MKRIEYRDAVAAMQDEVIAGYFEDKFAALPRLIRWSSDGRGISFEEFMGRKARRAQGGT